MIINGVYLKLAQPIKKMLSMKVREHGVSHGLSEVGYDIRIKQQVDFFPPDPWEMLDLIHNEKIYEVEYFKLALNRAFYGVTRVTNDDGTFIEKIGRTALASSIEEFDIPNYLWGELRNKSTHARRFFDATLGTDMEPGWKGFLTIEVIFHGNEDICILAGSGIAKAVFHEIKDNQISYAGKYQNQKDQPIEAILE